MNSGQPSSQPNYPPKAQQAPAPPPSQGSRPTISIENVELLEADRKQDVKRSRRGSRQQEASAAASGDGSRQHAGHETVPAPPVSSMYGAHAYGAFNQSDVVSASMATVGSSLRQAPTYYSVPPQQHQDPSVPSNFFYPNYVPAPSSGQQQSPHGLAPRQEPHYGMTYQGGYQTAGSGYYSPQAQQAPGYGGASFYPQQNMPGGGGVSTANEYSTMLTSGNNSLSSFDANYGSLSSGIGTGESYQAAPQQAYPRLSQPSTHPELPAPGNSRATGALTIDDIEKSFHALVSQHYPEPAQSSSSHTKHSSENTNTRPRAASQDKPRSGKAPTHRRGSSQASSTSTKQHHRRSGSTGNLPPVGPGRAPAPGGTRKKPDPVHVRSLSGTYIPTAGNSGASGASSPSPSHRRRTSLSRNGSAADLQSVGGQSIASHHSVVSDISKSALFKGVTKEGHVQLHFPYEAVRLVSNKSMESGRLYMQEISAAQYEAYHLTAEDLSTWDHRLDHEKRS